MLCVFSFGPNQCCNPLKHTLHPASWLRNGLYSFYTAPTAPRSLWVMWVPIKLLLEAKTETVSWIEVLRLCKPWWDLNVFVFVQLLYLFADESEVTVLLEDSVNEVFAMVTDAAHQISHKVHVQRSPSILLSICKIVNPSLWHAPPIHQWTPSEFEYALYQSVCKAPSWQFVCPLPPPIWVQSVDLSLIWEYDLLLVFNCPVFVVNWQGSIFSSCA